MQLQKKMVGSVWIGTGEGRGVACVSVRSVTWVSATSERGDQCKQNVRDVKLHSGALIWAGDRPQWARRDSIMGGWRGEEMKSLGKVRRGSGLIPSLCSWNSNVREWSSIRIPPPLPPPSFMIPEDPLIHTHNGSRWYHGPSKHSLSLSSSLFSLYSSISPSSSVSLSLS